MDFARPHRLEEGVATKSGIKILDELPPLLPSNQFTGATVPGVLASALADTTAAAAADADADTDTADAAVENGDGKASGDANATTTCTDAAEPETGSIDKKLDDMLLDAANRAAKDMLLGPPATKPKCRPCVEQSAKKVTEEGEENGDGEDVGGASSSNGNGSGNGANGDGDGDGDGGGQVACLAEEDDGDKKGAEEDRPLRLADSRLYPERCLPPSQIIVPNSLVVIFESFDSLSFAYATPGQAFSNRNGHFAHDDFIGKPYGCKIRSRSSGGLGFVYLLRPTPELWTRSLPHRTQIIHELDAAVIVCQLNLRPNCVVCESGTGSGSMSHSILRTIAPRGKLHTYEFNKGRVLQARDDFRKNGVGHLVDVHWRDVCGKEDAIVGASSGAGTGANDAAAGADGLASDPEHQARIEKGGFGLGPAKANAIFLDLPEPWLAVPHAAHTIVPGGRLGSYSPCIEQSQRLIAAIKEHGFHSVRTIEVRLKEYHVDEIDLEPPPFGRLPRDPPSQAPIPSSKAAKSSEGGLPPLKKPRRVPSTVSGNSAANFSGEDTGAEADTERSEAQEHGAGLASVVKNTAAIGARKRKLLVARPFATMRGHTAFLTFATAGNRSWPDPNVIAKK